MNDQKPSGNKALIIVGIVLLVLVLLCVGSAVLCGVARFILMPVDRQHVPQPPIESRQP